MAEVTAISIGDGSCISWTAKGCRALPWTGAITSYGVLATMCANTLDVMGASTTWCRLLLAATVSVAGAAIACRGTGADGSPLLRDMPEENCWIVDHTEVT